METTPHAELSSTRRTKDAGRDFIRQLQAEFPDDSPDQIANRYVKHCRESDPLDVEDLVWPRVKESVLLHIQPPRNRTPRTPQQRAAATAAKERMKSQIGARLGDHIESVVAIRLLDFVTPNGNRLGDCTGAQCRRMGGFFAEVGKRLSAREHVREHLEEAELQSIARTYRLGDK